MNRFHSFFDFPLIYQDIPAPRIHTVSVSGPEDLKAKVLEFSVLVSNAPQDISLAFCRKSPNKQEKQNLGEEFNNAYASQLPFLSLVRDTDFKICRIHFKIKVQLSKYRAS